MIDEEVGSYTEEATSTTTTTVESSNNNNNAQQATSSGGATTVGKWAVVNSSWVISNDGDGGVENKNSASTGGQSDCDGDDMNKTLQVLHIKSRLRPMKAYYM